MSAFAAVAAAAAGIVSRAISAALFDRIFPLGRRNLQPRALCRDMLIRPADVIDPAVLLKIIADADKAESDAADGGRAGTPVRADGGGRV